MLQFIDLMDHVDHALGGSPATQISYAKIVNDGGEHLFGMHDWAFRSRELKRLPFPDDGVKEYIDLPLDFGEFVGQPQKTAGRTETFELTTMDDINFHRHAAITTTTFYTKAALVFPTPDNRGRVAPPRLEIWPRPSSGNTQSVNMQYKARWIPLVNDRDVANAPHYAERLLTRLVRAFALGWEEDYNEEIEDRLEKIARSDLFQRTKETDGMVFPVTGPVRGGHISGRFRNRGIFTATVTSAGPS